MLKSINSKLFVSIGLVAVLIFGVFSYIFIKHQNKKLMAGFFREVSILSELITRATIFNMPINNRECIHRMMGIIGRHEDVETIRLYNKEGKVMFSTKQEELHKFVDRNAEACYKCHMSEKPLEQLSIADRTRIYQENGQRILGMITPIYNEPACNNGACHIHSRESSVLGVMDIGMSLADVDRELKRSQFIFILFTIITIVCFSSIIAFFIYRLVTKPVKKLVNGTQKIAQGNLDVEIPVKVKDEMGQLAISFNHMVHDLKKARQEIQSWNIEMERKVEERSDKLRMAREQLVQSEKMASMGVLASSVAHEINNPLQGILTYIKLMLKIILGDNEEIDKKKLTDFKNYLQLMGNEIERCGDMVKNLLIFSKQTKLAIEVVNINTIIKNSLLLVDNKIKLHNIEVVLNLQEDISTIFCDVKQIQQTLIAIIINSLEAMPGGGKIHIDTRVIDNQEVKITIADTGEGIPKKNLKHIFDPFFTTKDAARSTGLGLFVAYGIIREHKGTIEVESELGKGTEFHIRLPIRGVGFAPGDQ